MIKISFTRLFAFICVISFLVLSCKKNNDVTSSSKTVLLSFGPTGARPGDTLRFIGTNLDKVTSIQLIGASVDKANFKQQTSTLILIIVPSTTEKGYVTLKTPDGDIVSKTQLNIGVTATITSITAQARPGENITITGNYLNWVTQITFAKNKVVQTFVSKTINQIVVTVPVDAETGPLVLKYLGTDSLEVQTKDTLKVTLPIVISLSPNPVKHQTNVTITGTNIDLVKKVIFSGVSTPVTTFVSQSATQLVVSVPASTTKGKVTLEAASGVQTVSTIDLDVVLPSITSMSPNPIDIGANLIITGTNLDIVKSIAFVGVANAVTSFVSQTATQIVVKVPIGTLTGKPTFSILNSTLTVKSNNDLQINGSTVAPIIIYDDAITSAWNGWIGGGWGGTKDLNNTSPVKSGSKSIRIDYTSGGYGVPLQLGGANISLAGYTSLKFSIYGGTGSSGKSVNVGFNEVDGKTITIVEGQWTDFTIPLSQISSTTTLSFLYLKNYSASGDFTIYVDNLGIY
ncbi:MAG TPA: IPT/TIG domain-containing protein [Chitinophagaceae bacterium]